MAEWFETWFNTPYYHLLYSNRDQDEASLFIEKLNDAGFLGKASRILDLACGAGRHVNHLTRLGHEVMGLDLSEASISKARNSAVEGAKFEVGDMRAFSLNTRFAVVLNLFTSFGYFDDPAENALVLSGVHKHLTEGGCLIVDYLNVHQVVKDLVAEEVVVREGVLFTIRRRLEKDHVVKEIEVQDGDVRRKYFERVQLLNAVQLELMLSAAGFNLLRTFGDYLLNPFEQNSDRLILIARKNA
jgi:SAM-dependent methyltransferase